jgi:O-antigen/teichoic acid export membrane protein
MSSENGHSTNGAAPRGERAVATEPRGEQAVSTEQYGKTAGFLAVGVGITGVMTYGFFLVASHTLSKHDYGQIALLWSAVFITISALCCPVEQLLSRQVSERMAKGEPVNQTIRVAATIQFGMSLTFAVVALALRPLIQDDLLSGNETLYWVYFSAVIFYAVSYFARGFLAGSQRFGMFVGLILSESCFRTLFAVLVAVGLLSGQSAVAIGIVAAPILGLIIVPTIFFRRHVSERAAPPPPPVADGEHEHFSIRHGGGFAAAVLLIMFSEQAFLNAGPLIMRGLQGTVEAGYIFNVLMLARAPLQLFQSISTSILPHLTRLHTSEEPDSDKEFGHTVRMVLLGIGAFTALVTLVVLVAGPKCMQIAFGNKFTYDRLGLLLVTFGMGLYLCSVTFNQACVAQGQVRRCAGRWITCAVVFIAWNFVPLVSDEQRRVEVGFMLAAAVLCTLLWWAYAHPKDGHPEDVPQPGSPEELEARLAAFDETI